MFLLRNKKFFLIFLFTGWVFGFFLLAIHFIYGNKIDFYISKFFLIVIYYNFLLLGIYIIYFKKYLIINKIAQVVMNHRCGGVVIKIIFLLSLIMMFAGEDRIKSFFIYFFILNIVTTYILFFYKQNNIKKNVEENIYQKSKISKKYYLGAFVFCVIFLIFSINHLGKFMSVDEPKWLNDRVPQLYEAVFDGNFAETYINDKPGILPASLAGIVNIFVDHHIFDYSNIDLYLLWWRLPIVVFNTILLFIIFIFLSKLLDEKKALISLLMLATFPIIIGIGQVVNPDATMWGTGLIAFITFLLYIKTSSQKYILYSIAFLSLALVSKYFAIMYILFFIAHVCLDYLFDNKLGAEKRFTGRLLDIWFLLISSMIGYALLFPATWNNFYLIAKGTISSPIMVDAKYLILAAIGILLFEIVVLKARFSNYIKQSKIIIELIVFVSIVLSIGVICYLFINSLLDYRFFDPQFFIYNAQEWHGGQLFSNLFSSLYTLLFSLTPVIIFGLVLTIALLIYRSDKIESREVVLIISFFISVAIFIVGSAAGGFVAIPRYQIMLYPLLIIVSAIGFTAISKEMYGIFLGVIFLFSIIIVFKISPFYLQYENILNIHDTVISETWGYGGYEIAEKINNTDEAGKLVFWSDREGFNIFFKGESIWRGGHNPFDIENNVDYLILTLGGERIFNFAKNDWLEDKRYFYGYEAMYTPLLKYYQDIDPVYQFCVNDNENSCINVVKVDEDDLLFYAQNHPYKK